MKVQPVGPKETDKAKLRKCMSDNDPIEYDIDERSKRRDRNRRKKQKKSLGSNDSLDDDVSLGSDRGGSAGSKGSKKSDDSGLDMGEENHGFITEYSDPDKVKEIESNFKERDGLGECKIFYMWHFNIYCTVLFWPLHVFYPCRAVY